MKRYLAVYNYGQGGLWWYIEAESKEAIDQVFKGLIILEQRPAFWTERMEELAHPHRLGDPITDKALLMLKREN